MYSLRDTYKSYITFEITMLITKILVQSYTWIHFHSIFLLKLMFTMLSTQISLKSDPVKHVTMLSTQILVIYILGFIFIPHFWNHVFHVKYTDFSSILYLDTFSFHISVKSHVYHVKYTDLVQSYIWTHFQFFLLKPHVKYTSYLDYIFSSISVKSHVLLVKHNSSIRLGPC